MTTIPELVHQKFYAKYGSPGVVYAGLARQGPNDRVYQNMMEWAAINYYDPDTGEDYPALLPLDPEDPVVEKCAERVADAWAVLLGIAKARRT